MSYTSPITCDNTWLNELSIIKKSVYGGNGDIFIGVHGLPSSSPPYIDPYCPEFRTVYDSFATKPDDARALIYNTMVCDLVDALLWPRIDVFYFRACHINTGGEAHINWKNPGTFNSTAFNNPIHTADQGLLYDGLVKYTNLNWKASVNGVNYTQNSASMIMYIRTNIAAANKHHGTGLNADGKQCYINPRYITSNLAIIKTNDNTEVTALNANGSGLYINTRTAANVNKLYRNAVAIINGATASTGVPTHNPYEGAYNDDNVAAGFRADQVALHAYANGFSQADVTAFTNIIEAAMDALGTGVI